MSTRQRGKKLSTSKLSALERLKKARAGEKISDDEVEEEEIYDEEDEEDERKEDKIDKYKREKDARAREKMKRDKKASAREEEKTAERTKVKRHLTRDKTTGKSTKHDDETDEDEEDDEDQENAKKGQTMDIRAAFFKAAAKPKPSPIQADKKLTAAPSSHLTKPSKNHDVIEDEAMDEDGDGDGGDDLMNEIMKELKKQTAATSKPVNRATKLSGAAANLTLSPAHKRKLSPSTGQRHSPPGSESKAKKLDLDSMAVSVKAEPIDLEDASEELDNLALSNLNLDSVTPRTC